MKTNIINTKIEKLQTVKVDGVYVNLENTHLVLIEEKYQHVECIGDDCPLCKYVDIINEFNYNYLDTNGSKIEKVLVKDLNQLAFVNVIDDNNDFKRIRYKIPHTLSRFDAYDYLKAELPQYDQSVCLNWVTQTKIISELNNKEVSLKYIRDIKRVCEIFDFIPIPFNKYQYMKSQSEINLDKINGVINMIDELNVTIESKIIKILETNQK